MTDLRQPIRLGGLDEIVVVRPTLEQHPTICVSLQRFYHRNDLASKGLQRRDFMHVGHIEDRLLNAEAG